MASNNGTVGKWEVVKKGKKNPNSGGKPGDKKSGGGERKVLTESNLFTRPPPIISETLYDNFEKMAKKQNKEQMPPATAESQNKKPPMGKPSKKASPLNSPQPTSAHKNLEAAFKTLDVSELKQQLGRSQALFPESPSVWVKDLAGYLNHKLNVPENYPYCLAGKELKSVMKGLIGRCSDDLPDFFDHCVSTMLRELDRQPDEPLHGYRVCIQAILQDKPRIATQSLPEYLELLRSVQNRPAKCLTIMWALGQAGFYDLSQGLRVWLGIMLPVLGVKSLSSYALAYLQRLLMLHANLTKGFGIMGPKEFFPLLDFAFMPKNALSSSLQEQLRRLYPRLKVLAFGAKPESTLHTYLPSFLSRATPHCPDDMKRELLSSMTECLCVDVQSLGVWRQLYTKHLPQSSDSQCVTIQNLQETIQSFRVTNDEMRDTIESQELQECNALCQNLQVKMRSGGFPWSRLLMVLLVFVAGFMAQDIRSHGSFTDSTTARYLHSSGVAGVSQQAWGKVTVYTKQGFSWLETNMPFYYSESVRVLGPLMEQGLEKAKAAPKRRVFVGPPPAQVITNTPDSVFQALAYLKELLLLLYHDVILPALAFTAQLLQRIWNGLRDSCKSVTRNKSIHIYVPTHVHTHVRTHTLTHIKPHRQTDRPASKAITYFHSAV
uniref:Transmembrane protein 214 n=1 Tax=Gadus morhua TaxID=8049 RepID=A0A8C5CMA8_GADMO